MTSELTEFPTFTFAEEWERLTPLPVLPNSPPASESSPASTLPDDQEVIVPLPTPAKPPTAAEDPPMTDPEKKQPVTLPDEPISPPAVVEFPARTLPVAQL